MCISAELLDALKAARGGISDYQIAKELGVKQQTVSCYRRGLAQIPSEKAISICQQAGLNAAEYLLKLHRERAKCAAEVSIYDELISRMAA